MKNRVVQNLGIKVHMIVKELCRKLYRYIEDLCYVLENDAQRSEALECLAEYDTNLCNCELYYELVDLGNDHYDLQTWVRVLVDVVKKSTIVKTFLSLVSDVRSIISADVVVFNNGSEFMIEDNGSMWYVGVPLV